MSKPWILVSLRRLTATLLPAVVVALAGCSRSVEGRAERSARIGAMATPSVFVGRQACSSCHAREAALWAGSHHDLSMQEAAAPGAVLGDFEGRPVEGQGRETRFFRRGTEYAVRATGADGQPHDFAVAYTFGVSPLQQLLLPTQNGRLQAFSVAWDSRPAASGGQRWFSLYPGHSPASGDPLHWTGRDQNWNGMCADCFDYAHPEENRELAKLDPKMIPLLKKRYLYGIDQTSFLVDDQGESHRRSELAWYLTHFSAVRMDEFKAYRVVTLPVGLKQGFFGGLAGVNLPMSYLWVFNVQQDSKEENNINIRHLWAQHIFSSEFGRIFCVLKRFPPNIGGIMPTKELFMDEVIQGLRDGNVNPNCPDPLPVQGSGGGGGGAG
jgi:hypothetical protein